MAIVDINDTICWYRCYGFALKIQYFFVPLCSIIVLQYKDMKLYSDAELAQILDKKIFHKIGEVADEMHVECYLVGGYVRDIFL